MLTLVAGILVAVLMLPLAGWAKKHKPVYRDGVFLDFHYVATGTACSGGSSTDETVDAQTDDNGNTDGTIHASTASSSSCDDITKARYTISVANHTYVLQPYVTWAKFGVSALTLGTARFFYKNSVLYGQLPDTPIQVSSEGNGKFYVKVGKRESEYTLVGAK